MKAPAAALDHRRFWDAMDRLDEAALARVEADLGRRMVTEFGPDLSGLVLDMTNFATYVDSTNTRYYSSGSWDLGNLRLTGRCSLWCE